MPTKSDAAAPKSRKREPICARGMISLGKYVLVTMLRYVITLIIPELTVFEKKNQGPGAAYAKIGYGAPPDPIWPRRENTNVNTSIVASGCAIAHAKPKND